MLMNYPIVLLYEMYHCLKIIFIVFIGRWQQCLNNGVILYLLFEKKEIYQLGKRVLKSYKNSLMRITQPSIP